jgi:hypothetical protein
VNTESELELWRSAWRAPAAAETAPAFDFRAEHRRQEWRLRARYLFGLCFAVLLTCYAAFVLRRDFRAEVLAWAVVVWLTTAAATAFSVWNWRGLWSASSRSVREYADIYEKRGLATIRATRFGYWFLGMQLAIAAPWLTWDFFHHETSAARYAVTMGLLALLTIAFIVWFTVLRHRALSELDRVEEFRVGASNDNNPNSDGLHIMG